jgi:hypothetical protein
LYTIDTFAEEKHHSDDGQQRWHHEEGKQELFVVCISGHGVISWYKNSERCRGNTMAIAS